MITSILIAIAVVSVPVAVVLGPLMKQYIVRNVCDIIIVTPPTPLELKLKIYEDESCTITLTEIDLGNLNPPDSKSLIAYVKNYSRCCSRSFIVSSLH